MFNQSILDCSGYLLLNIKPLNNGNTVIFLSFFIPSMPKQYNNNKITIEKWKKCHGRISWKLATFVKDLNIMRRRKNCIKCACGVGKEQSDFSGNYRSPERRVRNYFLSGNPFSMPDLNCFLSCAYELRTGEKKIIFLNSLKRNNLWNRWGKSFSRWIFHIFSTCETKNIFFICKFVRCLLL